MVFEVAFEIKAFIYSQGMDLKAHEKYRKTK